MRDEAFGDEILTLPAEGPVRKNRVTDFFVRVTVLVEDAVLDWITVPPYAPLSRCVVHAADEFAPVGEAGATDVDVVDVVDVVVVVV